MLQRDDGDGAEQHHEGARVEREFDGGILCEAVADADEDKEERRDGAPGLDLVLHAARVWLRAHVQGEARGEDEEGHDGLRDRPVGQENSIFCEENEVPRRVFPCLQRFARKKQADGTD